MPDDYLVFDFETSGVKFSKALIVEAGWCLFRDRKPGNNGSVVLDWTRHPLIDQRQLRNDLEFVKQCVEFKKGKPTGKTYRFTYDVLREEGVDPNDALREFYGLIEDALVREELLAGHNAWYFDRNMLDSNVRRFLPDMKQLPWKATSIFDSGLIEKASQLPGNQGVPMATDDLTQYYTRIRDMRRSIKWALDTHCVPKYGLDVKHDLDMAAAHTAGFDCKVTGLLIEEYRELLEKHGS